MAQLTRATLIALAMVLLEGEQLHFALYHHSYLVAIAKKASNSPLRDTVPVSFFTEQAAFKGASRCTVGEVQFYRMRQ